MKRTTLFVILLVLVTPLLSAASTPKLMPLEVINQTGEDIWIQMDYPYTNLKVPVSALTVDPKHPNADAEWSRTRFTILEGEYKDAKIWACGGLFTGTLNMERRLLLNFVPCDEMFQTWSPRFWGEPSMEKPNLVKSPNSDIGWQFQYKFIGNAP